MRKFIRTNAKFLSLLSTYAFCMQDSGGFDRDIASIIADFIPLSRNLKQTYNTQEQITT